MRQVDKNSYDEAYFEGRKSNYWWTVGCYENFRNFPHWKEMLKLIRKYKNEGRLLDVGCAYGLFVATASQRYESYGIDISRFAVKKSKKYCRGTIARAAAKTLPFKDETFEVVTVVDTLEHISHLNECLRDIVRILKKNGILFLQLPNPLVWHLFGHLGLGDETHSNDFNLQQWKAILTKLGLKIRACSGMIAYAFRGIRIFAQSKRVISLFPELWLVAMK
ncbi:MAG: class I SAM-dependent methyltransferase [Candidatus Bathyarchaeota archaeon]|nr:MAG: class I SAM-dependent methyltransferase [Candidatus Bathyarchaeota archaeon]